MTWFSLSWEFLEKEIHLHTHLNLVTRVFFRYLRGQPHGRDGLKTDFLQKEVQPAGSGAADTGTSLGYRRGRNWAGKFEPANAAKAERAPTLEIVSQQKFLSSLLLLVSPGDLAAARQRGVGLSTPSKQD